jgi:lysozyme
MSASRWPNPLGASTADDTRKRLSTRGFRAPPGPLSVTRAPSAHDVSNARGFQPNELAISALGIDWLKRMESVHLMPYDDQAGKPITAWGAGASIGYGQLILAGEWEAYKAGIDAAQAEALLINDLRPAERGVRRSVRVNRQPYQYDALVSFAFNIGGAGFASSSVMRLINDPKATTAYSSLESAWKAWNKSQGKVMAGLNNRRSADRLTYTSARYGHW